MILLTAQQFWWSSESCNEQAMVQKSVVAAVLSLSIIIDNDVCGCPSMPPVIFHRNYYCDVVIRGQDRLSNVRWQYSTPLKSMWTTGSYVLYGLMPNYISVIKTSRFLVLLIVIKNSGRCFHSTVEAERSTAFCCESWDNSSKDHWARLTAYRPFKETQVQRPCCGATINPSWMSECTFLSRFWIFEVVLVQMEVELIIQ